MPLRSMTARFPRIRRLRGRQVGFKLGKFSWTTDADSPLLPANSDMEAVKLHAAMWAWRNGFETWGELLADPAKLDEFHNRNEQMKVRQG